LWYLDAKEDIWAENGGSRRIEERGAE